MARAPDRPDPCCGEARQRELDSTALPDPRRFADMVARETVAATADGRHGPARGHPAFVAVRCLPADARDGLRTAWGRIVSSSAPGCGPVPPELLIDPADGQFAGERDTLHRDSRCGLPTGTVISSTAVATAVVDELGALPGS